MYADQLIEKLFDKIEEAELPDEKEVKTKTEKKLIRLIDYIYDELADYLVTR